MCPRTFGLVNPFTRSVRIRLLLVMVEDRQESSGTRPFCLLRRPDLAHSKVRIEPVDTPFLDLMDGTITNIAAPTIVRNIGGGESLIKWLGASYTLPSTS